MIIQIRDLHCLLRLVVSNFLMAQVSFFFTDWSYFWLFSLRYETLRGIWLQRIPSVWTAVFLNFLKASWNSSASNYAKVCSQCCVSHYNFLDLSEWISNLVLNWIPSQEDDFQKLANKHKLQKGILSRSVSWDRSCNWTPVHSDYISKLWHTAFCYQMYKKKPGNSFSSFSEILIT